MKILDKVTAAVLKSILLSVVLTLMTTTAANAQSEKVDFTLADIDGKMHSLSDFRGQWVIVNFWATWCSPCIQEIPHLNKLSKITEPVQPFVIGIDFEEIDKDSLQQFMDKLEMDYLVLLVGDAPLIPFEPLKGMPTTFLVSPNGEIAAKWIGAVTEQKVLEKLSSLVNL